MGRIGAEDGGGGARERSSQPSAVAAPKEMAGELDEPLVAPQYSPVPIPLPILLLTAELLWQNPPGD